MQPSPRACQTQGENLANHGSAATWVGDSCRWSQEPRRSRWVTTQRGQGRQSLCLSLEGRAGLRATTLGGPGGDGAALPTHWPPPGWELALLWTGN